MNCLQQTVTDRWAIYNGDCVEVLKGLPDNSVHYSIFSPPFAALYVYSASAHDMGNSRDDNEFFRHFSFLVKELYRVIKPGRLLSFHSTLLCSSVYSHGYTGLRDFRGETVRAFTDGGWHMHSEVCIWKDPVCAMQRTKAKGLLYKELKKDSCSSRQGIPDYLTTMRKPGKNDEPVKKDDAMWPESKVAREGVNLWQNYASPVWATLGEQMPDGFFGILGTQVSGDDTSTINPTDTLQHRSAREHNDERHMCPLQLPVIDRAIRLWTNPGDVVLSPFAGIGSEGYVSLREGRKFVGAELKKSYYEQAVRNLTSASTLKQESLFT